MNSSGDILGFAQYVCLLAPRLPFVPVVLHRKVLSLGVVDAGAGRPAHTAGVQAAGGDTTRWRRGRNRGGRRFRIRNCRRLRERASNSAARKHSTPQLRPIAQGGNNSAGPKSLNRRRRCPVPARRRLCVLARRRSCVLGPRRYSAAVHRRGWRGARLRLQLGRPPRRLRRRSEAPRLNSVICRRGGSRRSTASSHVASRRFFRSRARRRGGAVP
jgi:hypothetical protein